MLDFTKFDILGMFELEDNKGIEKFVTPLSNGKFLSRSIDYYGQYTYSQCEKIREHLKSIFHEDLPDDKKFVIFENMLNLSAKVYYSELKKANGQKTDNLVKAKNCFEEDCYNLICIMIGQAVEKSISILPSGDELAESRQIELDNKALALLFCSQLKLDSDELVLLTGLGGLYLAPMVKVLYGCDYQIAPLSAYKDSKNLLNIQKLNLVEYIENPTLLKSAKSVVFLDDNIGTGATMRNIKQLLHEMDKECKVGAVQFNWINFGKVQRGEKNIERFDLNEIDFLTPFNFPGKNLLDHAINIHLSQSGDEYVSYIKSKGYRKDNVSDILTLAKRGIDHSKDCGIDLSCIGDINEVSFAMENAILTMCKTGDFSNLNKLMLISPVKQKL